MPKSIDIVIGILRLMRTQKTLKIKLWNLKLKSWFIWLSNCCLPRAMAKWTYYLAICNNKKLSFQSGGQLDNGVSLSFKKQNYIWIIWIKDNPEYKIKQKLYLYFISIFAKHVYFGITKSQALQAERYNGVLKARQSRMNFFKSKILLKTNI